MSKFFDESCLQSDEFEPVVPSGLCERCYAPATELDAILCPDCSSEAHDRFQRNPLSKRFKEESFIDLVF